MTVGIQHSEMRLHLDLHVATFVASRNDKRINKFQIFHTSSRGNAVTVGIQRCEIKSGAGVPAPLVIPSVSVGIQHSEIKSGVGVPALLSFRA